MNRKRKIPIASIDKIIREIGAERVSINATERLEEILEEIATKVALIALQASKHAGRKTVRKEDIDFALRELANISLKSLISKIEE